MATSDSSTRKANGVRLAIVIAALIAVAIRSMENFDGSQDKLRANLLWTLDLIKGAMESYNQPPR